MATKAMTTRGTATTAKMNHGIMCAPYRSERHDAFARDPKAVAVRDHGAADAGYGRRAAEDPDTDGMSIEQRRCVRRAVSDRAGAVGTDGGAAIPREPRRLEWAGGLAVGVGAASI